MTLFQQAMLSVFKQAFKYMVAIGMAFLIIALFLKLLIQGVAYWEHIVIGVQHALWDIEETLSLQVTSFMILLGAFIMTASCFGVGKLIKAGYVWRDHKGSICGVLMIIGAGELLVILGFLGSQDPTAPGMAAIGLLILLIGSIFVLSNEAPSSDSEVKKTSSRHGWIMIGYFLSLLALYFIVFPFASAPPSVKSYSCDGARITQEQE